MWASVYIVGLLEVVENDFDFIKLELTVSENPIFKSLDMKPLKISKYIPSFNLLNFNFPCSSYKRELAALNPVQHI